MHEHCSEDCDPVVAGNDLRRNRRPLHDECVTTNQLKQKTKTFTAIMNAATTGNRTGHREASLSGIKPPN